MGPPGFDPRRVRQLLENVASDPSSTEGELFPSAPAVGPCRICGELKELTEEHIPPRGAFNKQRALSIEIDAVLGRDELELPKEGDPPNSVVSPECRTVLHGFHMFDGAVED